eukprot:CAMPEP_0196592962 /NCGR_PEP_ID=MMETSP1081-20130531/74296_1 /TAXON_ID=36882 /ORGANISM="Pyramimonas amylifera, Strain CCMP720" /LENGTH=273 /DNA_ID=CAMNT_0041916793 /DNA_START=201 /DNA_END=1022 /DNA_ORIENTATION=-
MRKETCCTINSSITSELKQAVVLPATVIGRRLALGGLAMGFILTSQLLSNSNPAHAGFDRYIKKKPLDPIETYVPSLFLTRDQYALIDSELTASAPLDERVDTCKELLREGPAGAMRDNMRSVARYVAEEFGADSKVGREATSALDSFIISVDSLDGALNAAKRSKKFSGPQVAATQAHLEDVLTSIDKLLATLPTSVLVRSQAIADASSINFQLPPDDIPKPAIFEVVVEEDLDATMVEEQDLQDSSTEVIDKEPEVIKEESAVIKVSIEDF